MTLLATAMIPQTANAAESASLSDSQEADTMIIVNAYIDTLIVTRQRIDSIYSARIDSLRVTDSMTIANGAKYHRLIMPLTFYKSAAENAIELPQDPNNPQSYVDNALLDIYLRRPDLVKETQTSLMSDSPIRRELESEININVDYSEITEEAEAEPEPEEQSQIEITKPNFWDFSCEANFQLLQNFFSDNWYKGGDNTLSSVASLTLQANYDNESKLKFQNKLEMKIGFQTSPGDSVHKFKTNNDLLRYTGLLGLQATKNWYYSLQLLAYSQFSPGYNTNSATVISDFLSPLTVNVGLGMTYQVSAFGGKLSGSVSISALSYNWKYVDRLALAEDNGIDEGKHSKHDFGSQVTTSLTWKFNDNISWKTRIYYYTTYTETLFEWENTISCSLSKYISATIFLYPRFDDSATKDDGLGYWQFKEYCSLGLSYSF